MTDARRKVIADRLAELQAFRLDVEQRIQAHLTDYANLADPDRYLQQLQSRRVTFQLQISYLQDQLESLG